MKPCPARAGIGLRRLPVRDDTAKRELMLELRLVLR
jgi:hypothetical protein